VAPHPGALTALDAHLPHPLGDIAAHYAKDARGWVFELSLPPGLTGTFAWDGRSYPLAAGPNRIDLRR
jgi:hypothetical protein